jgi:hydroxypyruvate reductase
MDAVGAQEDCDAVLGLRPARIGGDGTEQKGGDEIEDRQRQDDPDDLRADLGCPSHAAQLITTNSVEKLLSLASADGLPQPCSVSFQPSFPPPFDVLEAIWRAGVESCLPDQFLPAVLPDPPAGRTILLALGKAALPMARIVERDWTRPLTGLAVTRHGSGEALRQIQVATASHPVPDASSVDAAERLLALAEGAGAEDLVLVLLSGGASSLACLPAEGLALDEKQRLTADLLRSGAPIGEVNIVRRHLSRFKGGRLALAAAPARLVTLAVSDVVGDAPRDIGSGPTAADPTTIEEAKAILARYGIAPPAAGWSESAKDVPGEYRVIASGRLAMDAAAAKARMLGYRPILIECEGEARNVAEVHAARILAAPPGTALITGGELTVTVSGAGRGGPNQEYALAAAVALAGHNDMFRACRRYGRAGRLRRRGGRLLRWRYGASRAGSGGGARRQ